MREIAYTVTVTPTVGDSLVYETVINFQPEL
jgi:hypothetical protein